MLVVGIDVQGLEEALLHLVIQALHDYGVLSEDVDWNPEIFRVLFVDLVGVLLLSHLDDLGNARIV